MKISPISFGKKLTTISWKPGRLMLPKGIKGITVDYFASEQKLTPENIAKGIKTMQMAEARGDYKDITNSVL